VRILSSALERERLCSGDPVCADHDPTAADDDRTLHGAACHGCLLVAETSCEARNLFLDRALIVDTVGQTGGASSDRGEATPFRRHPLEAARPPYSSGRSRSWIKMDNVEQRDEAEDQVDET
jgi:hypothetical protein